MTGQADAAAHRDAVGEGDQRLRVFRDQRVHLVLGPEELGRAIRLPVPDLVVERSYVSAGAESSAFAVEQDDLDVRVRLPRFERSGDVLDHAEVEGVDGLRAIEGESPERTLGTDEDSGCCGLIGHG